MSTEQAAGPVFDEKTDLSLELSEMAEKRKTPLADPSKKEHDGKAHYLGHRKRLRDRFLKSGPEALQDYELLELMLFQALPRGDTKPLAKKLLTRFETFSAVVTASPQELSTLDGVGEAVIAALKIAPAAAIRLAREDLLDRPIIGAWDQLLDYCHIAMAHEKIEQFRLLFLDKHNKLIADEIQQKGTVDHTPVYPREILKRALELNASAFVMIHNHPTGNPDPSKADIDMTLKVAKAAKALDIALHDHLIIGKSGYRSLRSMGYLS